MIHSACRKLLLLGVYTTLLEGQTVAYSVKRSHQAKQARLEVRQQKAQLQAILKAATIYKDGRIELEFRGESC
jgi:hypothetical protein